ncbi:MAG: TrkH family potassium uptake protein [Gammaproteobacteria bacterium]
MNVSDVSHALAQPVRLRVLTRYLGRIGLVVAALRCVPLLAAWVDADWPFLLRQIAAVSLLAAVCLPLSRIAAPEDIKDNEVLVITALSFFLSALAAGFSFQAEGLAGIDAFFEAVSAVTTTGLSTIADVESRSSGFLFSRAWMQWYGGLGIVVFSVALMFPDKGIVARRLAMGDIGDNRDILGNARSHSFKLLIVYASLTLAAIAALILAGAKPFSALTHALSAVSTGGFSIHNAGLAAENGPVQLTAALCGLLGAVSLPFYYRFAKNGIKELPSNPEIIALPVLTFLTLGLMFYCADARDIGTRMANAAVMALSAQSTTGFANVDVGGLDNTSKLGLIFSMLIGGSIGSTAGGVKILRLLVVLRLVQIFVQRTALPAHAVVERRLGGDRLEADEIERVAVLILIFAGTVLCSWLPFVAAGYPPLDALFEVVSACSTTGLSSGITSAELGPGLKALLIFDMLLGRVEFLAFIVFLYPRTWIKVRSSS